MPAADSEPESIQVGACQCRTRPPGVRPRCVSLDPSRPYPHANVYYNTGFRISSLIDCRCSSCEPQYLPHQLNCPALCCRWHKSDTGLTPGVQQRSESARAPPTKLEKYFARRTSPPLPRPPHPSPAAPGGSQVADYLRSAAKAALSAAAWAAWGRRCVYDGRRPLVVGPAFEYS